MAIDRYDWHSGGDFPSELPEEAGGTHIGFFLYWLITRGFIGDDHKADDNEYMELVRKGEKTGRDFLFQCCDGKFWDVDVAADVLPFVHKYYGDNRYYEDLEIALGKGHETIYHIADTAQNVLIICAVIDKKYNEWKLAQDRS